MLQINSLQCFYSHWKFHGLCKKAMWGCYLTVPRIKPHVAAIKLPLQCKLPRMGGKCGGLFQNAVSKKAHTSGYSSTMQFKKTCVSSLHRCMLEV